MSKFHVGDLVRVKEGLTFGNTGILGIEKDYCGKTFRVKSVTGDGEGVSIELEGGYPYYSFDPYWLEPVIVGKERIVIRHDGKTVTAILYNGKEEKKKANAKCHPDDPFDFMTGAKIALDRLAGDEEKKPKYKAGDFVVVKKDTSCHGFPIGSVVELQKEFIKDRSWFAAGIVPPLGGLKRRTIKLKDVEPYKEAKK